MLLCFPVSFTFLQLSWGEPRGSRDLTVIRGWKSSVVIVSPHLFYHKLQHGENILRASCTRQSDCQHEKGAWKLWIWPIGNLYKAHIHIWTCITYMYTRHINYIIVSNFTPINIHVVWLYIQKNVGSKMTENQAKEAWSATLVHI